MKVTLTKLTREFNESWTSILFVDTSKIDRNPSYNGDSQPHGVHSSCRTEPGDNEHVDTETSGDHGEYQPDLEEKRFEKFVQL